MLLTIPTQVWCKGRHNRAALFKQGRPAILKHMGYATKGLLSVLQTVCNHLLLLLQLQLLEVVAVETQACRGKEKSTEQHKPEELHAPYPGSTVIAGMLHTSSHLH